MAVFGGMSVDLVGRMHAPVSLGGLLATARVIGNWAPRWLARAPVEAVFSPPRTRAGGVTATALALAAGSLGGGDMIQLTRLPDRGEDLAARCEPFMRQFTGAANATGIEFDI
ncbi:hypothetical protein RM704_01550 [Streptomyces sp. DSM 3412]|uniref:Uncharacterized protein n=1 Tax=Streptomyces gottesmaniae TaxID=3075518 RepID=A0ABU2YSI1_9ACTN|nr:hypothetical protein [Streptomyces sp. DSM 3412]MDT0566177.1 hypothetical protein [Streptomyces sp. DSM 3412]